MTAGTIPINVELGHDLASLAGSELTLGFERDLSAELAARIQTLGLSGLPQVRTTLGDGQRPIRLSVHGKVQPYSPKVVRNAWRAAAPEEFQELPLQATSAGRGFPSRWVAEYSRNSGDPLILFAFIRRLVEAIVLERPSSLVGNSEVARYARETELKPAEVSGVIKPLLDLGVPVGDRERIARIVREGREIGRPIEDTVEAAFTELRTHEVELLVNPKSLARLALDPRSLARLRSVDQFKDSFSVYDPLTRKYHELFRDLERWFFGEYGFLLPRLVWVPTPELPERVLTIKVDASLSLPIPLLSPGERLVMAGPETATEELEGRRILHPVSAVPCTIVTHADKRSLEEAGHTTWGPMDFVILNILAELSSRAGGLLGIEDVEYQLARLRYMPFSVDGSAPSKPSATFVLDGPFPDLVHAALARKSLGDLTRIMRAMVAEGLSIENLPRILEALTRDDASFASCELVVVDDDAPSAARVASKDASWRSAYARLREQLASYLTAKYASYDNTLAYALDAQLEQQSRELARKARTTRPRSDKVEQFRDAVWQNIQPFAPAGFGQVLVTTPAARADIRELLEPELPELAVLSSSEFQAAPNFLPISPVAA